MFLLGWIILIILSPIIFLGLLMKYWEWSQLRKVYHIKTGKTLPSTSIFGLFWFTLFEKRGFLEIIKDQTNELGEIHGSWQLGTLVIRACNLELSKKILGDTDTFIKTQVSGAKELFSFLGERHLVNVNGSDWKRHRTILDPSFRRLENYESIFLDKTKVVLNQISKRGKFVDNVHDFTQKLALDILGKSIFGYDFNSVNEESNKSEYLEAYLSLFSLFNPKKILGSLILSPFPFLSINKKRVENEKSYDKLLWSLIDVSKKKMKNKDIQGELSMLDMMVEASQELNKDEGLSDTELRDNVSIFFLAGHETTANALAFGIQMLGKKPEIQDKIRKEVLKELKGGQVNCENTKTMDYLNAFIKEVMRVFPPVSMIPIKEVVKDTELGGYHIPKGTKVSVSILSVHNDKNVYGDPENFRPERWLKEEQEKRKIPTQAWIPFSSGQRVCIGNNFSLMEQRMFLAELLTRYQLKFADPKQEVKVSKESGLFQHPENAQMIFEPLN